MHGDPGDQFYVSIRADAVHLESATNQAGSIEFLNRGDGNNYNFQIVVSGGGIIQDQFWFGPPITYLEVHEVYQSIE